MGNTLDRVLQDRGRVVLVPIILVADGKIAGGGIGESRHHHVAHVAQTTIK